MKLCAGARDERRYQSLDEDDRRYAAFCVDLCGRVLETRPDQADALAAAGNHLTALGYYAAGLALDRRLTALRPRDSGAVYNLACSLALVGLDDEALAALGRAVDLGYHNAAHMAGDRDLKAIRKHPRFAEILRRARRAAADHPPDDGDD